MFPIRFRKARALTSGTTGLSATSFAAFFAALFALLFAAFRVPAPVAAQAADAPAG